MIFHHLSRLIAWIDSFGDRFNPITVRDVRRSKYRYMLEGATLIVLTLLTVGFLTALMVVDGDKELRHLLEIETVSRDEMAWYMAALPLAVSFYALLFYIILALSGLSKDRLEDELLGLVPLSPKEYVDGYVMSALIFSIFGISLFVPFVAAAGLVGRAPLWPLAALFGIFLALQTLATLVIAFGARMKRKWEGILLGISVYALMYLLAVPWFGCFFLLDEVCKKSEPDWNHGFGFFSIWGFMPLALITFAYVGYRLAIYHFTWRNAPYWRSVLINIGIYFASSVTLALIYLGLGIMFL